MNTSVAKTWVLYHGGGCSDGFAGAWAAWLVLGDGAEYVPVNHGEPPPDLPADARVVLVDFAYDRPTILTMGERTAELTILDHHKTAEEALRGLDGAIFDMDKSGAMLAWEFWHPSAEPPALIRYVQDRDLWRFALPDSREVNAALASYPLDFVVWNALDVAELAREGRAILRFKMETVKTIVGFARMGVVDGHTVPIVNATAHWSDVGEGLLERFPEAPFVASYFEDAEGTRRWSLRSRGTFDVSEVARRLGGGGHRAAAGFSERPGTGPGTSLENGTGTRAGGTG